MTDAIHVALGLGVLVVIVLLTIYVVDWARSLLTPIDARARLIINIVTILVVIALLALLWAFVPLWVHP